MASVGIRDCFVRHSKLFLHWLGLTLREQTLGCIPRGQTIQGPHSRTRSGSDTCMQWYSVIFNILNYKSQHWLYGSSIVVFYFICALLGGRRRCSWHDGIIMQSHACNGIMVMFFSTSLFFFSLYHVEHANLFPVIFCRANKQNQQFCFLMSIQRVEATPLMSSQGKQCVSKWNNNLNNAQLNNWNSRLSWRLEKSMRVLVSKSFNFCYIDQTLIYRQLDLAKGEHMSSIIILFEMPCVLNGYLHDLSFHNQRHVSLVTSFPSSDITIL